MSIATVARQSGCQYYQNDFRQTDSQSRAGSRVGQQLREDTSIDMSRVQNFDDYFHINQVSVKTKSNKKRLENDQIKKTARGGGTKPNIVIRCFVLLKPDSMGRWTYMDI